MKSVRAASAVVSQAVTRPPTVRVGVIGCGYWGPNLVRNFSTIDGCDLLAVCDREPQRLRAIQGRFPSTRAVADAQRLITSPGIDAVAICTPVKTHYRLARAALEAGKHVLIEKPMTDSVEQAEELVELADRLGLVLMVDHTFLYSGPVQTIKSILTSGEVGEVLYFDSVRINLGLFQDDVNVLWDLAPHDVSIMDFLLGREPRAVSAIGTKHFGDRENLAYMTVLFDGSMIAHFHVNWLAPVKIRSTIIGGTNRLVVYDDLAPSEKVRVYDKGVVLNGDAGARDQHRIGYRRGDMHAPYIENVEPLRRVCDDFVAAISRGETPLSDGRTGLRVVRILEAGHRSVERNGAYIEL